MSELSLPVLQLINQSRQTYGLRHQSFDRYQSHCATKVQHLRKAVGLTQTASKKQKQYAKKQVTPANATSDKHLQILLFDAERAWAHSQLLKATLQNPATSPHAKAHLHRRLSRAVLRADSLLSLVTSLGAAKLSVQDRAQVAAYYLVLKGSLAFEQGRHQEGLSTLSVAQSLLNVIASTANTAHDEALANEMIDDIEPMLRFCAYQLQLSTSDGIAPLVEATTEKVKETYLKGYDDLVAELRKSGGRIKREAVQLSWRGVDIPVRNAQLVGTILKVQTALKGLQADRSPAAGKKKAEGGRTLGAKRMGQYDRVLLVLSEAQDVATQLVEDHKIAARANSVRSESSAHALQSALSYIVYQLLSVRTKRDLLLIADTRSKLAAREAKVHKAEADFVAQNSTKDPATAEKKINKQRARVYPGLAKVYDGVVASLEQMRDLEAVEQDGDLSAQIEARIAFVRASRALVLSRTYALLGQYPSSLALNARAKLYAREARSLSSSLPPPEEDTFSDFDFVGDVLSLTPSSFETLDRDLVHNEDRARNDWYAATGGITDPNELPVEELSVTGGSEETAKKPKKKEAFYDVAFNYVAAFDMEAIAKKAGLRANVVDEDEVQVEDREDTSMVEAVKEKVDQVKEQTTPSKGWGFGLFGRK